jgi:hypothetical protein
MKKGSGEFKTFYDDLMITLKVRVHYLAEGMIKIKWSLLR